MSYSGSEQLREVCKTVIKCKKRIKKDDFFRAKMIPPNKTSSCENMTTKTQRNKCKFKSDNSLNNHRASSILRLRLVLRYLIKGGIIPTGRRPGRVRNVLQQRLVFRISILASDLEQFNFKICQCLKHDRDASNIPCQFCQ